MKRLVSLLFATLVCLISCDKLPTQGDNTSKDEVPVNLSLNICQSLYDSNECKVAPLKNYYLKLSANGAESIYDTISLSKYLSDSHGHIEIFRGYKLKPFRYWTAEAYIDDTNDSITHSGSTRLYVDEEIDDFLFEMFPKYVQLQALFYPLDNYPYGYGYITRCEVLLDNECVASLSKLYISKDTVKLNYNYVCLGKTYEIALNVWGNYFYESDMLLYSGSITKEVTNWWSNMDISVPLKWVGPDTVPSTSRNMDIIINPTTHMVISGKLDSFPVP